MRDATLIDYIYKKDSHNENISDTAQKIHETICQATSCDSVRERAKFFGHQISQISYQKKSQNISHIYRIGTPPRARPRRKF